ncbi:hypothetical protein ABGB06_23610 [Streptomyces sp. B6B3]
MKSTHMDRAKWTRAAIEQVGAILAWLQVSIRETLHRGSAAGQDPEVA